MGTPRVRRSRTLTRRLRPLPGGARIVHIAAEYWPFARTGGLAEAVRGLAEYQVAAGLNVTVILPLHRHVRERDTALEPVGEPFGFAIGDRVEEVRLYRATGDEAAPEVLFVEHPAYFDRPEIYGEGSDYPDNPRRFALFSRAVLEALPRIAPDAGVLHAHDWHTAPSIIYLRHTYAGLAPYDRIGTVVTVHNAGFQGHFPYGTLAEMGLPPSMYDWRLMEWYGHVNVLKGGLALCDMATTVSPTHAEELRTPAGGFGLQEQFTALGDRFVGILNGIDDVFWNPATDPYLTVHFEPDDRSSKERCKAVVQRFYKFRVRKRVPLLAMSARLVEQKGLDLILGGTALMNDDAQYVFLGVGERRYEEALAALADRAPDRIAVPRTFNEQAEHRLLAGADLLLMPSLYEPCGLTQMRAQRYGALPVVRSVGGLRDTVTDGVTGFMFGEYAPAALDAAVRRAIDCYHQGEYWEDMVGVAMHLDHSWGPSAEKYQTAYARAYAARNGGH
jgi:starch synthase